MSEWVGAGWLKAGGPALHVGRLPWRRSIAVYTINGSVIEVLAYCRGEAEARALMDVLDWLIPTLDGAA